ncbi:MAG: glycine zipper 2TM domain-containing protein [Pseudomonadota bacterium]
MTTRPNTAGAGVWVAAVSAAALLAQASAAGAQPSDYYNQGGQGGYDQGGPSDDYDQGGPPSGQYAPPPPDAQDQGGAYDERAEQADRDYADRYSAWAAQNCIQRRANNTAAGAIVGGVLGAVIGSSVAGRGDRGAGAFVGGALGATAGAAVGSSSTSDGGCPSGYVIRGGAPAFAYGAYGPGVVYAGPSWYRPWVWTGGRWTYRPYRNWYWTHRAAWRPGWHGRPWRNHRRWR